MGQPSTRMSLISEAQASKSGLQASWMTVTVKVTVTYTVTTTVIARRHWHESNPQKFNISNLPTVVIHSCDSQLHLKTRKKGLFFESATRSPDCSLLVNGQPFGGRLNTPRRRLQNSSPLIPTDLSTCSMHFQRMHREQPAVKARF
jgi:hypothetical protein